LTLTTDQQRGARVYVTQWSPGDYRLGVKLELSRGLRGGWTKAVEQSRLLYLEEETPSLVLVERDGQLVLVDPLSAGAELAVSVATVPAEALVLTEAMERRAQAGVLRAVSLGGDNYSAQLKMYPSEMVSDSPPRCEVTGGALTDGAGPLEVGIGDMYQLGVHPEGARAVYVTVVYINSEGVPVQLTPARGESPERLSVDIDRWVLPFCFTATAPVGREEYKLFATRQPIELGPIIGYADVNRTRGESYDGPLQLLLDGVGQSGRGPSISAVTQEGFTDSVILTVKE